MKKLLLLLTISILTLTTVQAQTNVYHPFPTSNAFWQYRHWNSLNASIHTQTRYGLNGDTIIGGNTYHKVFSLFDSTLTNPYSTYYAAIREQNKKIYTIIGSLPEHLLYDFNVLVGDTIHYDYSLSGGPGSFFRIVTTVDSFLLQDGKYRKRFSFAANSNAMPDTVVEGLGSIEWQGLFNPLINAWCTCGDGYEVTCIKENDTTLYLKNLLCDHCFCTFLTSLNEIEKQYTVVIYPNPTIGQFNIETNTTEKQIVRVLDVNGKVLLSENISGTTSIDASNLDEGIYTLTIKSNNSITTKKLVVVR